MVDNLMVETMHNDGSPLGNWYINSDLFRGLGMCPDKECDVFEKCIKCYFPFFTTCKTYIERHK